MEHRWVLNKTESQQAENQLLADERIGNKIPLPLLKILLQRGLNSYESIIDFFRPDYKKIHDPFLMKDMDRAVERVEKAIADKEKILIFGDYDVDGTSAVALMYSFLRKDVEQMEYYVPDRYEEGYGISVQSVEYARQKQFTLMIVLDCGIKCHQEIDLANQYGIDVIVCDHHLPDETLPNAYAVLDPKRVDCEYPFKELTGCGVGFKLIQAISQRRGVDMESLLLQYFDLLAISIASDVVPIVGENRILAYYGLRLINLRPRQGIESLLAYGKFVRNPQLNLSSDKKIRTIFNKEVTINDLVFCVGPRINAAGRMDTGRNSVHLLISDKEEKTKQLGENVEEKNNERRELDMQITKEAIEIFEPMAKNRRSIVVFDPSWSKGVVGIVASRLVEHFYRPAIVLTCSNDLVTGSARSVRDFDLYEALCKCSHLLEHFGGHTFAAGLSLKRENLEKFTEQFEQVVASSISQKSIMPTMDIDQEIDIADITNQFYDILKLMAPFGPQNMNPTFMTKGVVALNTKIVGGKHLKMSILQMSKRSFPIEAVAFGFGDDYERIAKGDSFNICYHVSMNEWHGKTSLQLIIKDIKFDFKPFDEV